MKTLPLLLLVIALTGCTAPVAVKDQSGSAPTVTTAVVKKQDLTGYVFFDGKLVVPTAAQANAFSPYDTPIVSVSTGPGKYVERGDPIIKLQIPGADEATSAAKANVNSAKASLSDQRSANSAPLKAAEQALSDARAAEKSARDTIAAGGTADLEAATQARIDAENALKEAQQQLNQTLAPSKEAVNESAANLEIIRADARKGIIRAPISGTVVTFDAKPGMAATSNQPLATIVNFEKARVQGTVPPELKDQVKKDSQVIIAMNGPSAAPLDGRVLDVTVLPPAAGQTSPGYLAIIEFVNPRAMPQPSLSVKSVGVKSGTVKDALVVSVGAITTKNGKSYVNVQNGSEWVSTPVEVGISDGVVTEIKSGVSEGAVVQVATQPATASS